ncbi:MAG: hypothetical protein V2A73_21170 [Pseudomonadota bacterium]
MSQKLAFDRVFEKWSRLSGSGTAAIACFLETGEPEQLAALGEQCGNNPYIHWLLEDLLRAMPDPPAFREADRRLLKVLAQPEERRLRLGEVPAIVLSETLGDLQKMSGIVLSTAGS